MKVAFVGCGWVADLYLSTLKSHPRLELAGVYDSDPVRADAFARHHRVRKFDSYEQLLGDASIGLVANLTNPRSHYAVSRQALEAGKHVYSEKPLATDLAQATELVALAEEKGLMLAGAPATLLGEAAQTAWKALRDGRVGKPRLVYAELDDGPLHLLDFKSWRSDSGAAWPWRDEFEVGCTLEHAGYYVSWLIAFFGPAVRVTSHAALLTPDKGVSDTPTTPDFSVGIIDFASGVTARVTCSIYGSHDHTLRVFGDEGVLLVKDAWDASSYVGWYPRKGPGLKAEKYLAQVHHAGLALVPIPRVRSGMEVSRQHTNRIDFSRGLAEVEAAIREQRSSRLNAKFSLHITEIVLALQSPNTMGACRTLQTTCEPPSPMDWGF